MIVKTILDAKGSKVWFVNAEQTLKEALKILIDNKIGCVLVFDPKKEAAGILSERDITRECHNHPDTWSKQLVSQAMTRILISVPPEATVQQVMELMTERRIRHIPVMKEGKLAGIVSIGDVVKARLKEAEDENKNIKEYFSQ